MENNDCNFYVESCPLVPLLFNGIFTTVCVAFGLFGSVASLVFIKRHYRGAKAAHKNTLEMLVVWDMILLLGTCGYYGLWNLFRCRKEYLDWTFPYMILIFHPILSTAYTASSCLIVLVSLEKFVGVSVLISRRKQKKFIRRVRTYMAYLISAFVILLNIPVYFEGKIVSCFDRDRNFTQYMWKKTQFRKNRTYFLFYRTITLGMVFTSLGPFIMIIALSVATISRIYRSYRVRLSMQRAFNNNRVVRRHSSVMQVHSIVATECLLITKFLVSHTIPACLDLWESTTLDPKDAAEVQNFMYLIYVSNFLVVMNSATNCLAYLRCGRALYGLMARTFKQYSAGEPLFTRQEVALLRESWQKLLERSEGNFGLWLLRRNLVNSERFMLVDILEIMENCDSPDSNPPPVPSPESPMAIDAEIVGRMITDFFTELFENLSVNSTRLDICGPIRHIGLVHRRRNVQINSSMWNSIKYWILTKANEAALAAHQSCSNGTSDGGHFTDTEGRIARDSICEMRQRAWEKLVCVIISEMKIGYMASETRSYGGSPSTINSTNQISRCPSGVVSLFEETAVFL